MKQLPPALRDVAAEFDRLPGIGPRAALRYAYWLITQPRDHIRRFAHALNKLADGIVLCETCGTWAEEATCDICKNSSRDQEKLCVVATSQDLRVIEESGAFKGRYHVLGGLIDPIEGRTPDTLRIKGLVARISNSLKGPTSYVLRPTSTDQNDPGPRTQDLGPITEVILAFDPDVSGDTTALYLIRQLEQFPVKTTRLARGLPTGAQLEYADGNTIADAIENRRG